MLVSDVLHGCLTLGSWLFDLLNFTNWEFVKFCLHMPMKPLYNNHGKHNILQLFLLSIVL